MDERPLHDLQEVIKLIKAQAPELKVALAADHNLEEIADDISDYCFSIEMARKPSTCKECHVGPDVPAAKVYASSKHGNIYSAMHKTWDFEAVPWKIGEDFTAPTCAD